MKTQLKELADSITFDQIPSFKEAVRIIQRLKETISPIDLENLDSEHEGSESHISLSQYANPEQVVQLIRQIEEEIITIVEHQIAEIASRAAYALSLLRSIKELDKQGYQALYPEIAFEIKTIYLPHYLEHFATGKIEKLFR